jgi:Right handed beta helix region
MRRTLGVLVGCCLLLSLLAVPAAAARKAGTLVDCGAGADLQAAITAATPGDTLLVRGTCTGNFIAYKDLVFEGVGPDPTIAGGGWGTVLMESGTVTISRLSIAGGALWGVAAGEGLLTLTHVTVRDFPHGGILVEGGGLTMTDCTVSGNGWVGILNYDPSSVAEIHRSAISGNAGVGIINTGRMTLIDSAVSANAGRGIENLSGLSGHGDLTIVDSTISRNADGGIVNYFDLSITRSKIVDNTTAGVGGGILNYNDEGTWWRGIITMSDSKVMGNSAADGGGIYNRGSVMNNPGSVPGTLILEGIVHIKNNTPNDCVGCWQLDP